MAVLPYYIYIMPREVYEMYKGTEEASVFEKLTEIYGKNVPEGAVDEYAIYFNSTYFATKCAGGEGFDEDTVIVLKVVPYSSNKRTLAKEQKSFEAHRELFKKMVGG